MRFRKMVIGITNAPLPSGDGKVVDGLTLGDLKLEDDQADGRAAQLEDEHSCARGLWMP